MSTIDGRRQADVAEQPAGAAARSDACLNTLVIAMRWGDMDAMGHVNNTVYFQYMEQVRIDWFDRLGIRPDPRGQGPVVVQVACTFRVPLVYPGAIELRHVVTGVGRSSIDTRVEIRRQDTPAVLCAEGTARIVWVDFATGRSTPLPQGVRETLVTKLGPAD